VAASRPHATALGIRLDLDDAAPDATVCADADRISQVVQNLLSNALKYSPPGERIRVLATRTAAGVRVSVEDRGPGVPEEFRRRLFQKFSQADASDARQKGGTGLGLAICKAIIDKLGGTIGHEPVLGGGARFYFELRELPSAA
jgi:signal transduction histidine kinase